MALVLLIGGYNFAKALVAKHLEYMSLQIQQTQILSENVKETTASNQRQEQLLEYILGEQAKESSQRRLEHKATQDSIDYFKGKKPESK